MTTQDNHTIPSKPGERASSLLLLIIAVGIYQTILALSDGLYEYTTLMCAIPVIIMAWGGLFIKSDIDRITRVSVIMGIMMLVVQYFAFGYKHNTSYYTPATTVGWTFLFTIFAMVTIFGATSLFTAKHHRLLFSLAVSIHIGMMIFMIHASARPKIDVWHFHQDSAAAILHGQNPYDITFENVYGQGSRVYSEEVQKDGRVLFGFPYPPMSMWMYLPSYWLTGESRYAHGLAYAFSALGMGLLCGRKLGLLAGTMFLAAPACWLVIQNSWTEPFLLFSLVVFIWSAIKCPRLMPITLGIFLSLKQYNVIFLPLVLLILPRPILSRKTAIFLFKTIVTMSVVTLPLALWNWHAFWNSTVTIQVKQPFRLDAFSFLSMLANAKEAEYEAIGKVFSPPGWWSAIAFVLMIPTWAILLWKSPRNAAGFAMSIGLTTIVFLFANRQAFLNYHTFAAGALLLAVAAFEAQRYQNKLSQAAD